MAELKPIEIMVLISNPENFASWSTEQQLQRFEAVLDWHDYIARLNPVRVPYVWGTHQILSQIRPSPVQDMYVAVYRVESLKEFDELMYLDPLRSSSQYMTILLTDLRNDLDDDKKRLQRAKDGLVSSGGDAAVQALSALRARFRAAPDFVGNQQPAEPQNPRVMYYRDKFAESVDEERKLQILIYGQNPPEYMTWDDARKLVHYEKVLWWHDHVADMLSSGRMSHVWGNQDFCDISILSSRSASGTAIYKVKDLDEFAEVYRLDPLRDSGRFLSVVLKPIDEQRKLDEMRVVASSKRLGARTNRVLP